MNAQEAADILGVNRRRHGDLLEMLRALTLYPWLNTAEDEKRRVAARWVLTNWKEYQNECARRRDAPPLEPGRQFCADRGEKRPPLRSTVFGDNSKAATFAKCVVCFDG